MEYRQTDRQIDRQTDRQTDRQGGLHTLTLPALAEDQMGNYSCVAQNSLGAYK